MHETKKYFVEEIEQSKLMSNKQKKVFTTLNYTDHFLLLVSVVTRCISISAFTILLDIPIGITSSPMGLEIYAITAETKKYKSIIKKKRNMVK